ncbi:hypothetical protein AG0111_0g12048 [Alternaria gaisen]|uniref:Uncharacterized protein n=1 Tax=Alternaria gaisen TaxID=167740 RepID=A0ACB6F5M0_9PLEO|nr:hypothetical protein AG0111_0g12048 [Alternaria gaisen]
MAPSQSKLTNHHYDHRMATWHLCSRCIDFLAGEDVRFLDLHGCCMPNTMEEGGEDLYDTWKTEEHIRCLRCHLMKQPCFALPKAIIKAFRDDLEAIYVAVSKLNRGSVKVTIDNPAYAEAIKAREATAAATPATGSAADATSAPTGPPLDEEGKAIPPRISVRRDLGVQEKSQLRERIRNKAAKIKARLAKEYSPYPEHLHFHNGAHIESEAPWGARPEGKGRSRSKLEVEARKLADKRKLDARVDALMDEVSKSSPSKRSRPNKASMDAIQAAIDGYQKEKDGYLKSHGKCKKAEAKARWQAKIDDVDTRIAGMRAQLDDDV